MRGIFAGIVGAVVGATIGCALIFALGCGRGGAQPCHPVVGDGNGSPTKRCEVRR